MSLLLIGFKIFWMFPSHVSLEILLHGELLVAYLAKFSSTAVTTPLKQVFFCFLPSFKQPLAPGTGVTFAPFLNSSFKVLFDDINI